MSIPLLEVHHEVEQAGHKQVVEGEHFRHPSPRPRQLTERPQRAAKYGSTHVSCVPVILGLHTTIIT